MSIKLIIGLKNPGSAYEHTRHNAGAWFVEALANLHHTSFKKEASLQCEVAQLTIDNHPLKIALPLTYMNHSGRATSLIAKFYKLKPEEILIAHDELDLTPGRVKLKTGGGHGGHNGLRDIISALGTPNFHRLRLGIGHPGHSHLVHDYVLGRPSQHDRQFIFDAITKSLTIVPNLTQGDIAGSMNIINR